MNIDLTYWYLFPVGLVIATLAMSAGISGANFWIPVHIICVKLRLLQFVLVNLIKPQMNTDKHR